jgi:flagellar basal body-associated protein FliL
MAKLKKALRLLCLIIMIILASFGMGITGNFLSNNRERYMNNEIRTEQVDKKEDEEDSESKEEKN